MSLKACSARTVSASEETISVSLPLIELELTKSPFIFL